MPQHPPTHDETVRLGSAGPNGRPSPDAARPEPSGVARGASEREFDDTRPVTRDWLQGAPESSLPERPVSETPGAGTVDVDHDGTQRLDMSDGAPADDTADTDTHFSSAILPGSDDGGDGPAGSPPGSGAPPGPRSPWWRRRPVLVPAGLLVALGTVYGVDLALAQGSMPRSTVVAGIDIGGLTPARAAETLEAELAPRVVAEHAVRADDVETTFAPAAAGMELDVDGTVDAADHQPLNPWTRLVTVFRDRQVTPVISGDETALAAQIETIASQVDRAPIDATIAIEGTTPRVVPPADGRELDRDGAAAAVTAALESGADPETPIELPVEVTPVLVDEAEAQQVLEETVTPALSAPVAVVGPDGTAAEVPVAAIAASLAFTAEEDGELAVGIDPQALKEALGDALSAFGSPAKDADFKVSGGTVTVVPSVDGTGVDPVKLADQLLSVLTDPAPRSVTAELGPVPADFTTEEAEALGIREEISSFTTRFTNPASGTNIRVVAAEVDGALIMPGETFSLNTYTGPRGTAQGYVEAAVIQNGELSKAVGGGISQFATTMFNAVFFAGLEDVFHKPHSFYISRYPAGREATVYEGSIDLVWRNDSDTGVYVDTRWTPGSITVAFYGTKRYEIQAIEGPRRNHREPPYQEKVDDGDCTEQPGIPGFDITVTRVFRDLATGAELRREIFHTRYAAEAIIKCVPPTDPTDPAAPPADPGTPGE
jgi:vancomycin resistance protein YoaR